MPRVKHVLITLLFAPAGLGLTAETASAHTPTSPSHTPTSVSGSISCPAGQQVTIVSKAVGHITHSFSKGPEHLGYTVYRREYYNSLYFTNSTRTGFQSAYWQVYAQDFYTTDGYLIHSGIGSAYAACVR